MKTLILFVTLLSSVACTTLKVNQFSVSRACKSGVKSYDDGSVNFECFNKNEIVVHDQWRTIK